MYLSDPALQPQLLDTLVLPILRYADEAYPDLGT